MRDQPPSTNFLARKSRSSGCDGAAPILPKSDGVSTRPVPKWWCQTRLTMTRAVRGWSVSGPSGETGRFPWSRSRIYRQSRRHRLDGGRQRSLARRATGETRERVDVAAGWIGTGHVRGLLHADAIFVLVEVLGEAGGAIGLTQQVAYITGAGHGALDCGARVDREKGMAGGQR